jgi:hypothetical protein
MALLTWSGLVKTIAYGIYIQFKEIAKKVVRPKNMVNPVWKSCHISVEVKRIVMSTCVRPTVEYGAEVWDPSTKQK